MARHLAIPYCSICLPTQPLAKSTFLGCFHTYHLYVDDLCGVAESNYVIAPLAGQFWGELTEDHSFAISQGFKPLTNSESRLKTTG
ncbi:MAG: hypothetical protein WBG73_10445 [Coleofasciculaceae cyanobacterium]